MQQRTFTATPMPVMRSPLRSRLILPTAVDQLRAALEARVAQAPDDVAARVSLGELNLSVALAETVREVASPAPDLLRARHVVPALASMALRK